MADKANGLRCGNCNNKIGKREYDKYFGLCRKCVNDNPELIKAKNETKTRILRKFFATREPIIVLNDDGTPRFVCYLPEMGVITDPSDESFAVNFKFNNISLERKGNTVGYAGFFFDADFFWATTPENMLKAWNWFNRTLGVDDNFWWNLTIDTIRDFLDNNWNTYENEMNNTFVPDILSLIWYLYWLDRANIDTKEKISEIRMHCKGRIRKFEKLSQTEHFSHDYRFSRKALKRITDIRESFAHLASEAELAAFAKSYGLSVELCRDPDIKINGKRIQVKKPEERYLPPKNIHGFTVMTNKDTELEKLGGLIENGFGQDADIVAISVNHLESRPIEGYKAKWGKELKLKNALTLALGYTTKNIVLLFKNTDNGHMGRIVKCEKKVLSAE